MNPSRRVLPDVVLLAVAAIWGGSYLGAQDLAAASSAGVVLCARFLPAALILLGLSAARGKLPALRSLARPGLLLGVLRGATIALETIGVTRTTATNAGLIIGLSVLATPIVESVATRRRLPAALPFSAGLGVLGIAGLVGGNGFATPHLGDLLVLVAALTRALLGVAEARVTAGSDADVLQLTTIEISCGALVFTAWGGPALLHRATRFTGGDWADVAYLSVGCTIVAFLGQLWATKHTSASRAGLLLGTEPGWALATGLVLAGDPLSPTALAGAALLLIAIAWGSRAERRWRTPPAPVAPDRAGAEVRSGSGGGRTGS